MDPRVQIASAFDLQKCLGCHACSIACKRVWTPEESSGHIWWNNVETKPGAGFPAAWANQPKSSGGWQLKKGRLELLSTGRARAFTDIFHHPEMPTLDEYGEPWTFAQDDLVSFPSCSDQPIAAARSAVTSGPLEIRNGPNWDGEYFNTSEIAELDHDLRGLTGREVEELLTVQRNLFFLPRICNHCLNPSCVAACPSGAVYKQGEDGTVRIDQQTCRNWRACIPACPYRKIYPNWKISKSEKCHLCYSRIERGEIPLCFQSCVSGSRFLGVLLYDAERIEEAASAEPERLVEAQLSLILDAKESTVVEAALRNGVSAETIAAARKSPIFKLAREWKIALPLHTEFRTIPMAFCIPPDPPDTRPFAEAASGRATEVDTWVHYLSNLFSAGNPKLVTEALARMSCIRESARELGDSSRFTETSNSIRPPLDRNQVREARELLNRSSLRTRIVLPRQAGTTGVRQC